MRDEGRVFRGRGAAAAGKRRRRAARSVRARRRDHRRLEYSALSTRFDRALSLRLGLSGARGVGVRGLERPRERRLRNRARPLLVRVGVRLVQGNILEPGGALRAGKRRRRGIERGREDERLTPLPFLLLLPLLLLLRDEDVRGAESRDGFLEAFPRGAQDVGEVAEETRAAEPDGVAFRAPPAPPPDDGGVALAVGVGGEGDVGLRVQVEAARRTRGGGRRGRRFLLGDSLRLRGGRGVRRVGGGAFARAFARSRGVGGGDAPRAPAPAPAPAPGGSPRGAARRRRRRGIAGPGCREHSRGGARARTLARWGRRGGVSRERGAIRLEARGGARSGRARGRGRGVRAGGAREAHVRRAPTVAARLDETRAIAPRARTRLGRVRGAARAGPGVVRDAPGARAASGRAGATRRHGETGARAGTSGEATGRETNWVRVGRREDFRVVSDPEQRVNEMHCCPSRLVSSRQPAPPAAVRARARAAPHAWSTPRERPRRRPPRARGRPARRGLRASSASGRRQSAPARRTPLETTRPPVLLPPPRPRPPPLRPPRPRAARSASRTAPRPRARSS